MNLFVKLLTRLTFESLFFFFFFFLFFFGHVLAKQVGVLYGLIFYISREVKIMFLFFCFRVYVDSENSSFLTYLKDSHSPLFTTFMDDGNVLLCFLLAVKECLQKNTFFRSVL